MSKPLPRDDEPLPPDPHEEALRELRGDRDRLLESLLNLMGLFDNAIYRRRLGDDPIYTESIKQAREALGTRYPNHPSPKP
jgi:hypothetical protein